VIEIGVQSGRFEAGQGQTAKNKPGERRLAGTAFGRRYGDDTQAMNPAS
jgi:hypothetical protein